MPKKSFDEWPEVILSNKQLTKRISQAVKEGSLRKIGPRLYTRNLDAQIEEIINQNLWLIVSKIYPHGLISDRTALDNRPAADGSIFLISTKKRPVSIGPFTIRPRKGHKALPSDLPFIGGLHLSSQARAFLENMKLSRSRKGRISRTLTQEELEERLERIYTRNGIEGLNALRDQAKVVSEALGLAKEYKKLTALIGAFLGTHSQRLKSTVGVARQSGKPYDQERASLFQALFVALQNSAPISRISRHFMSKELLNLAFFEAYFSNFIEGTEFEVDEAYRIIFKGEIPEERPADAQDIIGTYKLVSDSSEMKKIPHSFEEFLSLLKHRHFLIMEGRPEKTPGEFKTTLNRVGSTVFVEPELVTGTLFKGYEYYQALETPFHRAVFIMFLIAEVHPFADGNGRAARVMMNAELAAVGEYRVLIPTIYRNNYLSALRALSLHKRSEPLIRTLDFAQKYTSSIDFSTFEITQALLEKTHAFINPNIADEEGIRLKLPD